MDVDHICLGKELTVFYSPCSDVGPIVLTILVLAGVKMEGFDLQIGWVDLLRTSALAIEERTPG